MRQWHEAYPAYNLASNKGYATPDHLAALAAHGPSPLHRLSFEPVAAAAPFPGALPAEADARADRAFLRWGPRFEHHPRKPGRSLAASRSRPRQAHPAHRLPAVLPRGRAHPAASALDLLWDNNYFFSLDAEWRGFWLSSYVRGAVSGLGLVNLWIAGAEAVKLVRGR